MTTPPTSKPSSWTPLNLVKWAAGYLKKHQVDNARIEAEILLAHILGGRRIDLYLNHDQPLSQDELNGFKSVILRRVGGEPTAYITGTREFWSLGLAVNPAVLIPRPETECLVEAVLPFLDQRHGLPKRILDMGTGSGAIVIALAHEHPEHRYVAMDRSMAALIQARQNARRHRVDHCIDWFCGDWDSAFPQGRGIFDLIVANPPYIRSGDIQGLQTEIRDHEPQVALNGGVDGLMCLRRIIGSAHRHLRTGGMVSVELGYDQGEDLRSLAAQTGHYGFMRILKDYSGHDRVGLMEKIG